MNKYYYLCEDETIIRIFAKRKPSITTIPRCGTYIVHEYDGKKWIIPCFPEITWGRLSKLIYIGKTKIL